MFKLVTSSFTAITLSIFLLSGCADHSEALKVLPNELAIADQCKNTNKKYEMDCYDLISYKNSLFLNKTYVHCTIFPLNLFSNGF